MRRRRYIALLICASGALAALVWWLFYASYVNKIKNLPKQVTTENYFQFLDALSHLPSTEMPLDGHLHPRFEGGPNISDEWRAEQGVGASLVFLNARRSSDIEERSARIRVTFPAPLDLSRTILMARARVSGRLFSKDLAESRLEFELYDTQGRMLEGPKVKVSRSGRDVPLVVRPTTTEPIPTGFSDPDFDLARVKTIAVRFILGQPKSVAPATFNGILYIGQMLVVRDIGRIAKFFPVPDAGRVTQDRLNIKYELHRREWQKEEKQFFVGVNYPWRNYGWDFGKNPWGNIPPRDGWALHEEELARNFALLREAGVTHVRIYLFCDARTGFLVNDKGEYAVDPFVLEDAEAILRAAEKNKMKLIPVLFDFGMGNTEGSEYDAKGRPELIFSAQKYPFLTQAMIPFLGKFDALNEKHGKPVAYLELMNEPDNMALNMVPGFHEALRSWFKDLAVIVHNETGMKVTIGSRSLADVKRFWSGIDVDVYQFHFYSYMRHDMPPTPFGAARKTFGIENEMFCGELDPREMENIPRLKEQGYDGVLVWSYKANDGFDLDLDALKGIIQNLKKDSDKTEKNKK